MNAAGLIILSLGIILIIIGVKGSQHTVLQSLKGVVSKSSPASTKQSQSQPQGVGGTGPVVYA